MLNILLVEDHAFLRQKLAEFLRDEAFEVLEAEDTATALHLARAHPIDGVIVDIVLPPLPNQPATYHHSEGLNLVRALRQEKPTLPVLIQSSHPDRSRHFFDWLAEGQVGLGYILKHGSPDRLIHALHKVLQGQCYWDDQVQDRLAVVAELLDRLSPEERPLIAAALERIPALTPAETEIARRLAQSWANQTIAEERGRSTKTIEAQIHNIYAKTGLHQARAMGLNQHALLVKTLMLHDLQNNP